MRVIVTGGDGLLAQAIKEIATNDFDWLFVGRDEFDLTRPEQMRQRLTELRPAIVINTAAYNQVDRCETERERSWAVNASGPQQLGAACQQVGSRLVHYGTDYVFDGAKGAPYEEMDATNPINHYASGKLFGEQAVLRASSRNLVIRTSWVFGSHPTQRKTFVHTILRAVREQRELKATTDQISVPTFAGDLAAWTVKLIALEASGLIHAVNDESVSRFEWTRIILQEAVQAGLLALAPPVGAVTTDYFTSAIHRPAYTVMNNEKLCSLLGHRPGSWRSGLKKMIAREASQSLS